MLGLPPLPPDLRGPVSQPLHAVHALRILDETGRCGGQRAERVCRYLTSVSTPEGALPAVHPSLRGYPAGPWIPVTAAPPGDLLATGPVVGLLHRIEVWHAWLFRATDFCWAAVESLDKTHPTRPWPPSRSSTPPPTGPGPGRHRAPGADRA
jgi:hypothetical protein